MGEGDVYVVELTPGRRLPLDHLAARFVAFEIRQVWPQCGFICDRPYTKICTIHIREMPRWFVAYADHAALATAEVLGWHHSRCLMTTVSPSCIRLEAGYPSLELLHRLTGGPLWDSTTVSPRETIRRQPRFSREIGSPPWVPPSGGLCSLIPEL
jgi:hypothetical protein